MKGIQLRGILDKLTTLKDNSFKMTFETQELGADDGAELLKLRNTLGYLTFSTEDFVNVEVPNEPEKEFKTDKSPSQRLRAVIYVFWEKHWKRTIASFDAFYMQEMERIIGSYKSQID